MSARRELHARAAPLLVLYHPSIAEITTAREASMGERAGIGRDVLKRRGLLAGAAALVAGGLAKLSQERTAQAAHDYGGTPEALHADVDNTTTQQTRITRSNAAVSQTAFYVENNLGSAVTGLGTSESATVAGLNTVQTGQSIGVVGTVNSSTNNASGVKGEAGAGATNGVWGENGSPANTATGTYGLASAATGATVGVWGRSTSSTDGATGTRGEATAPSGATTGVLGRVSSPAGIAVRGIGGSGVGVFGGSTSNIGVYADSVSSTAVFATSPARAVWGRTTAGIGVFAQATAGGTVQARSYGIYAAAPGPGWAGYFEGNVYVTGSLTVASGAKSAAVDHPDGSQRRMYCQEAPEPWFEDFGKGKLANGRATITLDKDFAAVVKNDDYLVFLTEYGDSDGVYVSAQNPSGFQVSEKKGGASSAPFTYRVVARRKDAVGGRLEKLERPKKLDAKDFEAPKLPEAPLAPEKPATEHKPERRDAP